MTTAYLNGEFLPLEEARISPLDRGFLFGDAVYEVIAVYNQKCFESEPHLKRLNNSLAAIQISNPLTPAEYQHIFDRLIQDNGENQLLYIQITRGNQGKRSHAFQPGLKPTVFAMSMPLPSVRTEGVSAITMPDPRWENCYIKSINLLPNILLQQEAQAQGANECILMYEDTVSEGTSSNVFVVKNAVISTPPNQAGILPGITREHVVELAKSNGFTVREADISRSALEDADEIWVTSTSREITPVIELNNRPVGLGKPGPIWHTMYQLYQDSKN